MTTLASAFSTIRKDDDLAKKFVSDPLATLKGLGVDTANLHVHPVNTSNSINLPTAIEATVCGSIGCVVCASVG